MTARYQRDAEEMHALLSGYPIVVAEGAWSCDCDKKIGAVADATNHTRFVFCGTCKAGAVIVRWGL